MSDFPITITIKQDEKHGHLEVSRTGDLGVTTIVLLDAVGLSIYEIGKKKNKMPLTKREFLKLNKKIYKKYSDRMQGGESL